MTTLECRFLIIGAGPTGLGAAERLTELDEDYLIVDSEAQVGGMAASVTDADGFTWDLGGHVLHSHFAEFDSAVTRSGVELRQIRRHGGVWLAGKMMPAPIQRYLEQLPEDLQPDAPAANLAEYYRTRFGADLFERFFEPYTEKMWAHPLTEIDHAWTSLRSGSAAANVPRPGLARDQVEHEEFFPYPVGGAGALWEAVHTKLLDPNRTVLGTRIKAIDLRHRTALLDDGRLVHYAHCVSTAPLPWLIDAAGLRGTTGADRLTSSTVIAVGVGVNGQAPPALLDRTWIYCPERDVPWYRATMMSTYDPDNAGEGRWSVLCETSTSAWRPRRNDDVISSTVASLEALGLDRDSIATVWSRTVPLGYPVPTLGRDDLLHRLDDLLLAHGVHSRGRFGGWRYESCNQDYSFMQGRQAVDNALFGSPENVYWKPELSR